MPVGGKPENSLEQVDPYNATPEQNLEFVGEIKVSVRVIGLGSTEVLSIDECCDVALTKGKLPIVITQDSANKKEEWNTLKPKVIQAINSIHPYVATEGGNFILVALKEKQHRSDSSTSQRE